MAVAAVNGLELYYEAFGDPQDPLLLLISGLGAHCTGYDDAFCEALTDLGVRVVRFDNRDVGLSTHMDDGAVYSLADMAGDAVGLLDHMEVERAHIWGTSMGGMIAQELVITRPDRVRTLVSVMSTTGESGVGMVDPSLVGDLLAFAQPADGVDAAIEQGMRLAYAIGSRDHFDEEYHRVRQTSFVTRRHDPAGVGRQLAAIFTARDRAEYLCAIEVPTLVIHGTADLLVTPSGGRRTAELIGGAELVEVDGMAHDLPPVFWPVYLDAFSALIA